MGPTTSRAAEARAHVLRGKELYDQGHWAQALEVYATVVEQFGFPLSEGLRGEVAGAVADDLDTGAPQLGECDEETGAVVAWALSAAGLALGKLGRPDGALAAWEQLVARFGGSEHPKTRMTVARSFYAETVMLSRLGRTDAALTALGAVPAYDELIDPKLAGEMAASMQQLAQRLHRAGRLEDELRVYDDLLERFTRADDPGLQEHVATTFVNKAHSLGQIGQLEQANDVYDEMLEHFKGAGRASVKATREAARDFAVATMQRQAEARERVGQAGVAIAYLDGALGILSDSSEPVSVRRKLDCLVAKARLLERGGRHDEATVVLDGAVAAYGELPEPERDARSLGQVVHALLLEVISIGAVDPLRSSTLIDQLNSLLGDVAEPRDGPVAPSGQSPTDEEIAARLAELNNSQCWLEFATSGEDPASLAQMASKALALYRPTRSRAAGGG